MTTLTVASTTNFSANVLNNIDIIDFTNLVSTTATATFANTQFNNVAILNSVLFDGSAGVNAVVVNGGTVNASSWTFAGWTAGTDTIRLNGSGAADTITGSSQNDIIDGGQGADALTGGGGDDIFDYSALELSAGETINGGAGTGDTLRLNQAAGTYAFSTNASVLTGMERIEFNSTNTVSAEFTGGQVSQFTTIVGGTGTDTFQVTGSSNISAITFQSWSVADRIRLLGSSAAAETITGSSLNDFFNGGAGNDILNGGLGDDIFNYTNAADVAGAGEQINGEGGTGDRIELANAGSILLSAATITGVEVLDFLSGASTANLGSAQIGNSAGVINNVDGSAGADALVVAGPGVNISGVTFTNWNEAVDTITIFGSNAATNSLIGSDLKDTINGGALGDLINGLGGADNLNGGSGDDDFAYNTAVSIEAGEQINGGADFDRIKVSTSNVLEAFDFSGASVTDVEALRFEGSGGSLVTLLASQVGAGKIFEFQFIGSGSNNVSILGAADLSTLVVSGTFDFLDSITITGTSAVDVITGSSVRDIIEGGDGADTLNGGGGDDVFIYSSPSQSPAGETINGGGGAGDTIRVTEAVSLNLNIVGLSNVERLDFDHTLGTTFANLASTQIGTGAIISVDGSVSADSLGIEGTSINMTAVTFTNWTSGADRIFLIGTAGNDIILGSSQDDEIELSSGTDTVLGGLGDDEFIYKSNNAAGDSIDGGGGAGDALMLRQLGNFDLTVIGLLSGIEKWVFDATGAQTIVANGTQLAGLTGIIGDSNANRLNVNGAAVNLSGVTFTNWLAGEDIININGTSGIDTLTGSSQDDTFDGGGGADLMNGGNGNDAFRYTSAGQVAAGEIINGQGGTGDALVLEFAGNLDFSNTALSNVELLTFGAGGGFAEFSGTQLGTAAGRINAIVGNTGADRFDIEGSAINLTGVGFTGWTNANDSIFLFGTAGNDTITGSSQDDRLFGNLGLDTLIGGSGNDEFSVGDFNAGDVLNGGAGTGDLINLRGAVNISAASITGIERMVLDDTAGLVPVSVTAVGSQFGAGGFIEVSGNFTVDSLTVNGANVNLSGVTFLNWTDGTDLITINGTAGADLLTGSARTDRINGGVDAVSDTLAGGLGNDTYIINTGSDLITEFVAGGTADVVQASVSFTLANDDYIEFMQTTNAALTTAINLTGNALRQTITGNAGSNILNGGVDAVSDTLAGGLGNDTYVINTGSDLITEFVAGGTADVVQASVSFTLANDDYIETMQTTNAALTTAINLTGNSVTQTIIGNAGANILNGMFGNDTLTGGLGSDFFLFNTTLGAANHDAITDFNAAADTIQLENAIFTALTAAGTLAAGLFKDLSLAAQDANDIIVYNRATGDLFYDANGLTAGGQTLFADVANGTVLTFADFVVV